MGFTEDQTKIYNHPMLLWDETDKYVYCFAIGVMAMGDMRAITELRTVYEQLIDELELPLSRQQQVIIDINSYLETRLNEVRTVICTKKRQYCLLLDLYRLMDKSVWAREYCQKIIENYIAVFQFDAEEVRFLTQMQEAMASCNEEQVRQAYRLFTQQGYEIPYAVMKYFFPTFHLQHIIQNMQIKDGDLALFEGEVFIEGDVLVEAGGTLCFRDAEVTIQGRICLQGGRLRIEHAKVYAGQCRDLYLLQVVSTSVVIVDRSMIDLQNNCGFVRQFAGRLILKDSMLCHSGQTAMIRFAGASMVVKRCEFLDGKMGLLFLESAADVRIEQSSFTNGTAEYGGAVYSESIGSVELLQCNFWTCKAKYLGDAVYFKYYKLGQRCEQCAVDGKESEAGSFFQEDAAIVQMLEHQKEQR